MINMNKAIKRNQATLKRKGVELSIFRQRLRKESIPADLIIKHVKKKGIDCEDNC